MFGSRRSQSTFALAFLILLLIPISNSQSQVIQRSIEKLSQESDAVVIGRVAGLTSEWNESKTRIQTRVTISVDQNVKGDGAMKSMTVLIPGGEVGGIGEVYSHAPKFKNDENVIVFAKKAKQGYYQVSEGAQGKYSVVKDEVSGRLMVAGANTLEAFTGRVKAAMQVQEAKQ
jgi:hypothetical protein